jgi:hypothetical protein
MVSILNLHITKKDCKHPIYGAFVSMNGLFFIFLKIVLNEI